MLLGKADTLLAERARMALADAMTPIWGALQQPVTAARGALLYRLDEVLRAATGLPVVVAEEPLSCVALGTGRALEEMKRLRQVLSSMY
jgi:actin-like ATPase involved in cell morphogenesis